MLNVIILSVIILSVMAPPLAAWHQEEQYICVSVSKEAKPSWATVTLVVSFAANFASVNAP